MPNSLARSLRALFLAAISILSIPGKDWPEFRGPSGQGHSDAHNLPLEWSSTNHVAWKQSIPGQGWSSPVLFQNRIYLTTAVQTNNGYSLRALSLDGSSGQILWDKEVFSEPSSSSRIHGKNSHSSPTPIAEPNRLYVHFGHQGTACLDLNGQILWTNVSFAYSPVHGNGGSPILAHDRLVFSADGASDPFIAALDKTNGNVLWKTPRAVESDRTFSFSTPLLITVNNREEIISPASNALCAYDPLDGHEIWRVRYDGYSVIPRPVYGHELVYISTGFDHPAVMAIRPDGEGDVTSTHVAWTLRKGAPNTPSLLLVESELYMVSDGGIASCVDARTGLVHWQERLGGNFSASPLDGEGRIYFQNEEGTGFVIQAATTFKLLSKNPLDERTLASYAADDGSFFIRSAEHLYRITN